MLLDPFPLLLLIFCLYLVHLLSWLLCVRRNFFSGPVYLEFCSTSCMFKGISFFSLGKKIERPMNIQEAYRTPNRRDQKRNSSWHIIIRTTSAQNKDKILKAVRGNGQVTYKGRPIRITPDFSPEAMKARRSWTEVKQTLREYKCQAKLLYSAKFSITIDEETKVFHDKSKFTQYLSRNPALQRIIKGNSTQEQKLYARKSKK